MSLGRLFQRAVDEGIKYFAYISVLLAGTMKFLSFLKLYPRASTVSGKRLFRYDGVRLFLTLKVRINFWYFLRFSNDSPPISL